jgi:ATP-dependent helicase/nuclease subunit A
LPEAVDDLFASLPVLELAAASLHGEQAVANLMKIRQMAAELADRPQLTLHGFVDLMIARLSEQPKEAESALAEESMEAVRVLTIHKAKGLEFPVVILPGLHHGANPREDSIVAHDWSTGLLGLSLGERRSFGAVLVGEKARVREEAERYRVFYVGMTRARERVILSGGLPARLARGTFLALLKEAAGDGVGDSDRQTIQIGSVAIEQTVLAATDRAPRDWVKAPAELQSGQRWADLAAQWTRRDLAWEEARLTPRRLTPALLMRQNVAAKAGWPGRASQDGERVRLLGTLAHRVLEGWDFAISSETLVKQIGMICRQEIPEAWAAETAALEAELKEMFATFAASEPFAELRQATILGREIPFAIPWHNGQQIMEGVLDVLYELDGKVWIADYKTDRLETDELAGRAAKYAIQAQAYREAVSRCLGLEQVGFKFIFVRNGAVVQV